MRMRQEIKHRDIRLLNMIRRTDPVIPCWKPRMEISLWPIGSAIVIRWNSLVCGSVSTTPILIMANSPQLETKQAWTVLKLASRSLWLVQVHRGTVPLSTDSLYQVSFWGVLTLFKGGVTEIQQKYNYLCNTFWKDDKISFFLINKQIKIKN